MVLRRRNAPPPYEVMGSISRTQGSPPPGAGAGAEPPVITRAPTALSRSHAPVVLRVPRGWAVAGVVALLAALTLAYWVGQSRGYDKGLRYAQQQREATERSAAAVLQGPATPATPAVTAPISALPPHPAADSVALPPEVTPREEQFHSTQRQVGLNYLLLASYNKPEADRLVAYLARFGVDATVIPSTIKGLFQVVALRGFTAEERVSRTGAQYQEQLKQLGRKWKKEEKGPDELEHCFWEKYKGT